MNDQETTVLTSRLHQLADELTPPLDVVGQVRDARARHRRRRRTRIVLLSAATATTAALIGVPLTFGSPTSAPPGGVAGPAPTSATAADPGEADRRAAEEALARAQEAARHAGGGTASIPDGWVPHTFQDVTFAVPPGARSADSATDRPVSSWTDGPSLVWNGPHLGGDAYSSVTLTLTEPFEGGLPPRGCGRSFTVPGAEKAYGNIEYAAATDGDQEPDRTIVWLEMLAGDRVVTLDAVFAAGPEGEQMAHDLVASIVIG
jgi:hypothetical protein